MLQSATTRVACLNNPNTGTDEDTFTKVSTRWTYDPYAVVHTKKFLESSENNYNFPEAEAPITVNREHNNVAQDTAACLNNPNYCDLKASTTTAPIAVNSEQQHRNAAQNATVIIKERLQRFQMAVQVHGVDRLKTKGHHERMTEIFAGQLSPELVANPDQVQVLLVAMTERVHHLQQLRGQRPSFQFYGMQRGNSVVEYLPYTDDATKPRLRFLVRPEMVDLLIEACSNRFYSCGNGLLYEWLSEGDRKLLQRAVGGPQSLITIQQRK